MPERKEEEQEDGDCKIGPIIRPVANSREAKIQMLNAFIAEWAHLPSQRSPQWYKDRLYSVGASELSTLIGQNPHSNIYKFIGKKFGLLGEDDRRAMNWGNVLEHVVGLYIEDIFICQLAELGAIPVGGMRNHRASPDGLAFVSCLGNAIVSFEIKAPLRRQPNGKIPTTYVSQVLSQLDAIPIADFAIFVDVVLRRCGLGQWSFTSLDYDYVYHSHLRYEEVSALCMLHFKIVPSVEQMADGLRELLSESANGPINFGECRPELFDILLEQVAVTKRVRAIYGKIYTDAESPPSPESELAGHESTIGYLPIKMMKAIIIPKARQPGFTLQFQPTIDKIMVSVKAIDEAPDCDKMETFIAECAKNGWRADDGQHRRGGH